MDAQTAAAMCAGMNRDAYLAGRLVYAQDWSCLGPVKIYLFERACKLAIRKRWRVIDGNRRIEAMTCMALIEASSLKRYKSDSERARALDVPRQNYSTIYKHRYADIVDILASMVDAYNGHLRKKGRVE